MLNLFNYSTALICFQINFNLVESAYYIAIIRHLSTCHFKINRFDKFSNLYEWKRHPRFNGSSNFEFFWIGCVKFNWNL